MRAGTAMLGAAAVVLVGAVGWRVSREEAAPAPSMTATPADPAAALADLQQRAAAAPGDAAVQRDLARALFALGRYEAAAAGFARVTKLQPGDAVAWASLGEAQTLADNAVTGPAHDAFAQALRLDPKSPRARYFLAVEKDVAGDHAGAVRDWTALLADAPPGAPWAASVRTLIGQVAGREAIPVALPPTAVGAMATGSDVAEGIPGPSAEQLRDAAQLTPAQQDQMARGMVERLAAKLAANPRDATGWARLMRARLVLGDRAGAQAAAASARAALADDPASLAVVTEAGRTLGL